MTIRKNKSSKSKSKALPKKAKAKSRQFYSEIAGKKSKKAPKKAKAPAKMKKMAPNAGRELLSEIGKVGKQIRRRVKRAL